MSTNAERVFWKIYGFLLAIPLNQRTQHLYPDNKVHGANMGPICALSAPDDGLHKPCYQGTHLKQAGDSLIP